LRTLMLTNNRLKPTPDLEVLAPLASLPHLTHLDLGENFVPEENPERQEARLRIFKKLPNLQYLDGEDINNRADEDDDDEEDEDDDDDDEEDEEEDAVNGMVNGLGGDDGLGDDELDEDDELEEEEEAESDEDDLEDEGRKHLSNGLNGAYDEDSDAEDEQEDEDDDDESSHHSGGKTGGKTGAGRGKKRKYEDDNP